MLAKRFEQLFSEFSIIPFAHSFSMLNNISQTKASKTEQPGLIIAKQGIARLSTNSKI